MDLNPQQFFHGSSRSFEPGDTLFPRGTNGVKGAQDWGYHLNTHSKSGVFSHPDEGEAWHYAEHSSFASGHEGRATVYQVQPSSDVRVGHEVDGERVSSTAQVKHSIDIKPGRQGTLPINWNQFKPKDSASYVDLNHPGDWDLDAEERAREKKSATPNTSLETLTDGPKPDRHQGRLF